jgi:diguanylate cyclase (GGDEF)-like protein
MPIESIWLLIIGGALCSLGGIGGIIVERSRLKWVVKDLEERLRLIPELTRRSSDLHRRTHLLEAENSNLSSFLIVLPDIVRRLNVKATSRNIPEMLAGALEQVFEPAQLLIYMMKGKEELVLVHAKGLPEDIEAHRRIQVGKGQIGLVARLQRTMNRDDLQSESSHYSIDKNDDPAWLAAELAAPMIHEGETRGVISIGGIGKHHGDEKRMIKLVADLGSLALDRYELFVKWERIVNADSLTRLSTKRFLFEKLGELTYQATRTHHPLSVIMLDIDHFKQFNDTFGHLSGDEVLRGAAAVIRSQLRSDDLAARYGGEEFVVVLPNTGKPEALAVGEKIRAAIEQHIFDRAGQRKAGRITISGGVACHPFDGNTSIEVLRAADQALYLAKGQGRNRVVPYQTRYLSEEDSVEG